MFVLKNLGALKQFCLGIGVIDHTFEGQKDLVQICTEHITIVLRSWLQDEGLARQEVPPCLLFTQHGPQKWSENTHPNRSLLVSMRLLRLTSSLHPLH